MQNYKVDKQLQFSKKFKYIKKSKKFKKKCNYKSIVITSAPYMYGLQILENGYLFRSQLECFRRLLNRSAKKKIKLKVCVLPDKPITKKSQGARMGRGKGNFLTYVYKARKGQVVLQFSSILNKYKTLTVLSNLISKVSFKCCIVYRPRVFIRSDWFRFI